ncbi:TRAP transporter small permease [Thalassobaculum sp.]|uniref:TRAP transporter small permease n=1 Tax=Thalassobaculum sp. TaxID=2022740 RepID=UPI0032EB2110
MIRRCLDGLYLGAGMLAALFMVSIGVLIVTSVIARLFGSYVPGLNQYAGYAMAASSFLALAYTFRAGGHIRVALVLSRLEGRTRWLAELWCLGVGAFLAGYVARFSIKMVQVSHMLGDVSEGVDATPLWIPQLGMAIGSTIFTIALLDRLVAVARGAPIEKIGGEPAAVE